MEQWLQTYNANSMCDAVTMVAASVICSNECENYAGMSAQAGPALGLGVTLGLGCQVAYEIPFAWVWRSWSQYFEVLRLRSHVQLL